MAGGQREQEGSGRRRVAVAEGSMRLAGAWGQQEPEGSRSVRAAGSVRSAGSMKTAWSVRAAGSGGIPHS